MKTKARGFLLYFVFIPFCLSLLSFFTMNFASKLQTYIIVSVVPFIIGGILAGVFATKRQKKQDRLKELYKITLYPLTFTAVVWAVCMLISGGFYGDESWLFFGILHFPLIPVFFFATLMGALKLLFWAPFSYELSFALAAAITMLSTRQWPSFPKKQALTVLCVFVLAIGTGSFVQIQRSKTVLEPYGYEYGGGYSSTDLYPYDVTNPDNILPNIKGVSDFTVSNLSDMPILDGAEAAYPVYSAFANATYVNISNLNVNQEIVTFTNTIYSYERLLAGEIDIYFGAEPSKEQRGMAEKQGKELVMTPIGKEAFVFFVNPNNKVDNLNVSQIQDIYSGKIKNWSEVGGENEDIIAFQRPKNSGSQTLLEKIMGDAPIMQPLKEEMVDGMGGILEQVADYRNYDNALGFSFRYFATGMTGHQDIKLLAINGIEPSPENISREKYPFTASLYAITLKDNKKEAVKPFLEWMTGPQGQWIVEEVGYIPLNQ